MNIRIGKKAMEVEMMVKIALVVVVILISLAIGYAAFGKTAGEEGLLARLFSSLRGGG